MGSSSIKKGNALAVINISNVWY